MLLYSRDHYNRDIIIINSGSRGNGKSRRLIKILKIACKLDGEKFSFKDKTNIYYTSIEGLQERLSNGRKLKIGIDEGYFAAPSAKAQSSKVKDFIIQLTAIRQRGHLIVINFTKINRAAKMLLEIADYWIHGPSIDWGVLLARDREFTGDDPWEVEPLMKARGRLKRRNLLLRNENFITQMAIKPILQASFDKYDQEKDKAQRKQSAEVVRLRYSEMVRNIANDLFTQINDNVLEVGQISEELKKRGLAPLIVADVEKEVQKLLLASAFTKAKTYKDVNEYDNEDDVNA